MIVFEGADRCGKTTQSQQYADFLRRTGVSVADGAPWRFPDRSTSIGGMISSYLQNKDDLDLHVLHLLFSANRWEKAASIRENLLAGRTVILDRYVYSGIAYSVANGLPMDWCRVPDAGLPAPDVVVYMDLPQDIARQRGEYGNERYENEKMQTAVSKVFAELKTNRWHVVDANADENTVFSRVLSTISQALDQISLTENLDTLC